MIQLRDYQIELVNKGLATLKRLNIVYFAVEVRCGKTLVSMDCAQKFGAKKVLFLTKKRAFSSIQKDYEALKPSFEIVIMNRESLHKIEETGFDLLVNDENHNISSFPKMSKQAKEIKERWGNLPMIFLSGTPAIESGSQWFHSFQISNYSPWNKISNFYSWFKIYGCIKTSFDFNGIQFPNYTNTEEIVRKYFEKGYRNISKEDPEKEEKKKEIERIVNENINKCKESQKRIYSIVEPYLITFTQKEAGFESEITENVLYFDLPEQSHEIVRRLLKNRVIIGKEETILADTPVKLMNKIHQVENGTVIFESGNSKVLNTEKAWFIFNHFAGKKIAIFYYFQKELEILKQVFGENLTTDLQEFNETNKNFAIQQVSGSEGISLKAAQYLVYYNFGYSGKNFTQGVARMQTIDRKENNVFFIFCKGGINEKIYKVLKEKKTYSERIFKKEYGIKK